MAWKRRAHDDFANGIQSHLALEAARLIDEGLIPDEARAAAHRRFGSVVAANERSYELSHGLWWDHMQQDVVIGNRPAKAHNSGPPGKDAGLVGTQ